MMHDVSYCIFCCWGGMSYTVLLTLLCYNIIVARELKQDWPVDSTVFLEDMTWEQGNYQTCIPKHTVEHLEV